MTNLQQAAARVQELVDIWDNGQIEVYPVNPYSPPRMKDCLRTLLGAVKEIERLTNCLEKANANHEHFEREWYLQKDKAESQATEIERLRELLAKTAGVLQVAIERKTKPYDTIVFGGPRFASTGGVVVSELLDEVDAALADQTGGEG